MLNGYDAFAARDNGSLPFATILERAAADRALCSWSRQCWLNQPLYDAIVIRTEPHFQTGILAGGTWCARVVCDVRYKGRLVWTASHSSASCMLEELAHVVRTPSFAAAAYAVDTSDLCDQEGCQERWTHTDCVKQDYCEHCGRGTAAANEWPPRPTIRKFCSIHTQRSVYTSDNERKEESMRALKNRVETTNDTHLC